jgi:acyl dehydratase
VTAHSLHLTPELLYAYSRGGNFHSDPEAAAQLGYTRLLAAGMQVFGPAYSALLDAWGDGFIATGSFDLKFVGGAYGDETVDAAVAVEGDHASITVTVRESGVTAVVGTARRDQGHIQPECDF